MKRLFFAAAAMVAMLASCSKNESTTPATNNDSPQVTITLSDPTSTRAFFDNTASAETWESEIKSLTVYVFNSTGNFLLHRTFTAPELAAKKAAFALPNSTRLSSCTFYAVANHDPVMAATRDEMEAILDATLLTEYNSDDAANLSACMRAGGFVMSGKTIESIRETGTTNVAITIKRTTSKIAVKTTILPEFAEKYNGASLVITSATISKANNRSYLIAQTNTNYAGTPVFSHTQAPQISDGFNNLFYIYGTISQSSPSDRVTLTLTGYMDADGNPATTDDRVDTKYTISVDGAGTGQIYRNGYYRIDARIKGLSGEGIIADITVSDWETPITQEVELGN